MKNLILITTLILTVLSVTDFPDTKPMTTAYSKTCSTDLSHGKGCR